MPLSEKRVPNSWEYIKVVVCNRKVDHPRLCCTLRESKTLPPVFS
jgi:hypothetical protein